MIFQDYEKDLIRLLNENKVKYLLVGGQAVSYYSSDRLPNDTDFFYERDKQNAERLVDAINSYHDKKNLCVRKLNPKELVNQVKTLGIGPPKMEKIDLLNDLEGVKFEEAWENKETTEIDVEPSLSIDILGKDELITNKETHVQSLRRKLQKHEEDIKSLNFD